MQQQQQQGVQQQGQQLYQFVYVKDGEQCCGTSKCFAIEQQQQQGQQQQQQQEEQDEQDYYVVGHRRQQPQQQAAVITTTTTTQQEIYDIMGKIKRQEQSELNQKKESYIKQFLNRLKERLEMEDELR